MKKLFIWAMSAMSALVVFFAANSSFSAYAAGKDVSSLGLSVTLKQKEFDYTGDMIRPEYMLNGKTGWTTEDQQTDNYSIGYRYNINAGTGSIVAVGKGEYTGQTTLATFTIKPLDIKDRNDLVININSAVYTGAPVLPSLDITLGTRTLKESVDYTISAENNTNIGYVSGTVNFIGNYTGTRSIYFNIALAPINHFTAYAGGSGNVLKWDSVNADKITIFRQDDNGGALKVIGTTTGSEFTDTSAPQLVNCFYTIQTEASQNGKKYTALSYSRKISAGLKAPTVSVAYNNGSAVLSWDSNANAAGYFVYMDGKPITDLRGANNTTYTVDNVSASDKHSFTVSVFGNVNGQTYYSPQSEPAGSKLAEEPGVLKNAVKGDTRSFTITDTQKETSTPGGTVTLSDDDMATLEKFAAEHFTEGMTDTEKLLITMDWINRSTNYALTTSDWNKIAKSSYVDAIFNKQTGQCAQYNGAMVSMMRYLGYQANMILGWRGSYPSNYWQHYWGEIEIDGTKYILECGNYGRSGSWSYFLTPYERTDGKYIINCKNMEAKSGWYYDDWWFWY